MSFEVRCPHCGHENTVDGPDRNIVRPHLVVCDVDRGGCDKEFAYKTTVKTTYETEIYILDKQ